MPHPGDPGLVAMPGVCPTPGLLGASRSRGLPDPGAKRPWSMPGVARPPPVPGSLGTAHKAGWRENSAEKSAMAEESPRTKLRKEIETAKEIQALETELAQIKQATSALQRSAPSVAPATAAAPSTEPAASSSASTPAVVQIALQQPAKDDGQPSVNAAILRARGHDRASSGAGGAPLA